jgi:large subunit ribosomal protein L22
MADSGKEVAGPARQFLARHRFAPTSARKARYAVDLIRGLPVNQALERLQWCPRRAASMVRKVLQSAVANAGQDLDVDANRLYVADARGDDGPTAKRGKARSRGQFFGILVRHCHITVVLKEAPEDGIPGRRRRVRGVGRAKDKAAAAGAAPKEA